MELIFFNVWIWKIQNVYTCFGDIDTWVFILALVITIYETGITHSWNRVNNNTNLKADVKVSEHVGMAHHLVGTQ